MSSPKKVARAGGHRLRSVMIGGWLALAGGLLVHEEGFFWRDAATRLEAAREALDRGAWREALDIIQEVRFVEVDSAYLSTLEGRALLGLGDASSAADRYRDAAGHAPNDAEPRLGLAEALLSIGDSTGARLALSDALERCPDPACIDRFARLSDAAGDAYAALRGYEVLASPSTVGDRLRLYMETEQWDEAVRLIRSAADSAGEPDRRSELAWALVSSDRHGAAEEIYRGLADDGALGVTDAIRYAWLLTEDRRYEEALTALDPHRGVSSEVDDLVIRSTVWAGRPTEALHMLEQFRQRWPGAAVTAELTGEVERAIHELAVREAAARASASPPADPEGALEFWRQRLDESPTDADVRHEVVALLEQAERFEEAYAVLLEGEDPEGPADAEVLEHRARLSAWAGDHERAVFWYRAYERSVDPVRSEVAVAFAAALLDIDAPAEALERLPEPSTASDPKALVLGARAAQRAGRPGLTVRYLERLADTRGLATAELQWLGGAYRDAGMPREAADAWTLVLRQRTDDEGLRAALASALMELEDWSEILSVFQPLLGDGTGPDALWLARALSEQGRSLEAAATYSAYVDAHPEHRAARLALARTLASFGREGAAIPHYMAYGSEWADSLSLEIARAHLGVQDWAAAEEWGRKAVENDGSNQAKLTLAQALIYQGRSGEADELLGAVVSSERVTSGDRLLQARAARLMGQPLRVQRILGEVTDAEPEVQAEVAVLRAEAAWDRGDMHTLGRALESARRLGAAHRLEDLEDRFDRETRSRASLVVAAGEGDPVQESTLRADATAWPMGARFRLGAFVEPRRFRSLGDRSELISAGATLGRFFIADDVRLGAGAGLIAREGAGAALLGNAFLDKMFVGGSELGISLGRRPIWDEEPTAMPTRPLSLRSSGPDVAGLMLTDVRLRGTRALGQRRNVQLGIGRSWYADQNDKTYAFGHVQLPVSSAVGRWVALQPNVYWEDFTVQQPGYASPSGFWSAGLRAQGIWESGSHDLRLEVNPHMFGFSDDRGLGVDASVESGHRLGPARLLVGASYFKQADIFTHWRVSTGVQVPLGRPRTARATRGGN